MSQCKSQTESVLSRSPASLRVPFEISAASVLKVVCAVLLTALAAQVRIFVVGPVPITLQTLAVLLTGFALGARLAPVAMLLYVGLGAVGLPFFAVGLVGPTGGYIVGFVFAAAFLGRFGRAGGGRWLRTAVVAATGTALIFVFGLVWLAVWLKWDFRAAFLTGFVPFWPGAVLKTAVAVAAVRAWRRTVAGFRGR